MLILGVESSCDETGIALYDSAAGLLSHALHSQVAMHAEYGGVVPELASRDHIRRVVPLLRSTLENAGKSLTDIDAVAFGSGPGSFTGLRVACGVAQGLAVARDLPLLGVGTLEAMAYASGAARVIVALDARMGEVYVGYFEDGRLCSELGVYPPGSVPLPQSGGWLACGSGISAYPVLRERLAPWVEGWRPEIAPNAEAVLRLAAPRLARGETIDPADAYPVYVRDKVAKTVVERLAEGGKA